MANNKNFTINTNVGEDSATLERIGAGKAKAPEVAEVATVGKNKLKKKTANKTKRINFVTTPALYAAIKERAEQENCTVTEFVTWCIKEQLY